MDKERALAPFVTVVVPVYRSAAILPRLVMEIEAAMQEAGLAARFELLLVCDASPDSSWQVIESLAAKNSFLRGICLRKNTGQHNATMAGLNHSRGDIVVVMDDDLQHPPSAIPRLVAELEKGFDVCYTRYRNRRHALWKKLGSRVNDAMATIVLSKPPGLYLSSFKALRREVVREVIKYEGPFAYVDGLILDITRAIASVEIDHNERLSGVGNYNLRKSISLWLKMVTSFSIYPLRLMSFLGAAIAFLSLIVIAYVLVTKLIDPSIPAGWTSLIAAVLFVGGVQMLGLGLIGEYLGRVYLNLNRKPQYVVSQMTWKP